MRTTAGVVRQAERQGMKPPRTEEEFEITPLRLFYAPDGGEPTMIPSWAQACLLLGHTVARDDRRDTRNVVGLSLPTRAYASGLVAAGVVLERASVTTADPNTNFRYLAGLRHGAALVYNRDGKALRAVFDGTQLVQGNLRLRVRIQKKSSGGATYLLDERQSLGLQVVEGVDGEGALAHRLHRNGHSRESFLENLIADTDSFLLYPRLDCLIVGTIAEIRNELRLPLMSDGRIERCSGTLSDILRVRRFLADGQTYRSEVLATGADTTPQLGTPHVTVFDGALSFLKWREAWRRTEWVVILDRTEPHFPEAVNVLNQAYTNDRIDDPDGLTLPSLPDGMELLSFRERL